MKKRIIIYYSKFSIGGAEMSNLRMMKKFLEYGWDVELVLKSSGGSLESQLPDGVKVSYLDKGISLYENKSPKLLKKLIKFYKNSIQFLMMQTYRFKNYDIAIIGYQGLNGYFISNCVKSELKLHWIRSDLKGCDPTGRVKNNIEKYSDNIDAYPCVSNTTYESFIQAFPNLTDRALLYYNFLDKNEMIQKANNVTNPFKGYNPDILKVVTVCRISDKSKGVFRMLNIYKRLRDSGQMFYWFIIGDGADFKELDRKVKEYKLQDGFILLGRRPNPFPYYKYADISATLSYYEGLSGTVNEAKVMGKPVLATKFSGIDEQIEHMKNGYIVENNDDSIYNGLLLLLTNKEVRDTITNNKLPLAISDDLKKIEILESLFDRKIRV